MFLLSCANACRPTFSAFVFNELNDDDDDDDDINIATPGCKSNTHSLVFRQTDSSSNGSRHNTPAESHPHPAAIQQQPPASVAEASAAPASALTTMRLIVVARTDRSDARPLMPHRGTTFVRSQFEVGSQSVYGRRRIQKGRGSLRRVRSLQKFWSVALRELCRILSQTYCAV